MFRRGSLVLVLACACACGRTSASIGKAPETKDASHEDDPTRSDRLMTLGAFGSCARVVRGAEAGRAKCWGHGGFEFDKHPQTLPEMKGEIVDLAIGVDHACAVMRAGDVDCWGLDDRGQVGRPATKTAWLFPLAVAGLPKIASATIGGSEATCAIDVDGALFCWGDNSDLQLGVVLAKGAWFSATPIRVPIPPVREIAMGDDHACALADRRVYCWGRNRAGELGDGTTTDRVTPEPIDDLEATQIASGEHNVCALLVDGGVSCWGGHYPLRPTRIAGVARAVEIAVAYDFQCARTEDGAVSCWGTNDHGQLGDGTTIDRSAPAPILGVKKALEIAAGGLHACARVEDRVAYCWGFNSENEVDGSADKAIATPRRIAW